MEDCKWHSLILMIFLSSRLRALDAIATLRRNLNRYRQRTPPVSGNDTWHTRCVIYIHISVIQPMPVAWAR